MLPSSSSFMLKYQLAKYAVLVQLLGYEGQFIEAGTVEENVVPNGSKFSCGLCGKEFNHKNTTRRHIRFVHEAASGSTVTCHLCSSTLKNEQSLKAHLRTSHTVFTPR